MNLGLLPSVPTERFWKKGRGAKGDLDHHGAIQFLIEYLDNVSSGQTLAGVGHRVVHGGLTYSTPIRITSKVLEALEAFIPLAPLHQSHNLTPVRLLLKNSPELPQVACFDTAFHRTNSELSQRFAIPQELHEQGIRRYGFHGLSYEYVAGRLPQTCLGYPSDRAVVLHLGNGASMCAVKGGKSIASTMGFTALDGLPMGTRCGNLDPGVLLYFMDQLEMDAQTIEELIYRQSGLLGVSGICNDMRVLLASEEPGAKRAIDLFVYRIQREIGSLAAALGGADAIVFTAGVGENAPYIREQVLAGTDWLNCFIDPELNTGGGPRISREDSSVSAWVIPTNEELMIARHTAQVIGLN